MSKRHLQRSIATARLTDPDTAVDVGFLDVTVDPADVVETAVAEAASMANLDAGAYARMMRELRGEVLVEMADQIASDRTG